MYARGIRAHTSAYKCDWLSKHVTFQYAGLRETLFDLCWCEATVIWSNDLTLQRLPSRRLTHQLKKQYYLLMSPRRRHVRLANIQLRAAFPIDSSRESSRELFRAFIQFRWFNETALVRPFKKAISLWDSAKFLHSLPIFYLFIYLFFFFFSFQFY